VDDDPDPMVTEVTDVPPDDVANTPPAELDDTLTVVAEPTLTGLPEEFSTWQTIGPKVALFDAAPETGEVVMTSFVATDPVTTVSDIPDPQVLVAEPLFESPP
jgi:hypothetical protein